MTDVPTLTSTTTANYSVMNPLTMSVANFLSNANLRINASSTGNVKGTIGVTSGQWYWETYITSTSLYNGPTFGVSSLDGNGYGFGTVYAGARSGTGAYVASSGITVSGSTTFANGDIIACALDLTNSQLKVYKNNTLAYTFSNLPSSTQYFPFISTDSSSDDLSMNFGQRPFTYTAPSGFLPLNTYNLPTSTIVQGNKYMDATLYTGNGVNAPNALSITNAGSFQPDLVWIKLRSGADIHNLEDSIIGTGYRLSTNNSNALSATGGGDVSSFNSNGFTISYNNNWTNANGSTYVAWQWKANNSSVTNTAGTITTTVSANTTAGFSVLAFTYGGNGVASTAGHGLGVAPTFIITKGLSLSTDWIVYHKYLNATPQNYGIVLNGAGTPIATSQYWNNTAPTSTVYSVGTQGNTNANAGGQISYCFTDIAGFSKFGSYTGNGSADGTFVYLGFRPAFIMLKNINTTDSWLTKDYQRASNYNPASGNLYPNLNLAEDTGSGAYIDLLSNGFKIRGSNNSTNGNGNTIIYAAFAENPFKNALAR